MSAALSSNLTRSLKPSISMNSFRVEPRFEVHWSTALGAAPYILDIDLDAFHLTQAISPRDPATFYRPIKNAVAITIATEAE